jgi:hypothetical protein
MTKIVHHDVDRVHLVDVAAEWVIVEWVSVIAAVVADAVVAPVKLVARAENITMESSSMPMRNNMIKEATLQLVDGDEAADVVVVD